MNKWKKTNEKIKSNRDGLKTRMPDATEILKGFQNMTHLECLMHARKKVPDPIFFYDGGVPSAAQKRVFLEAFLVWGKNSDKLGGIQVSVRPYIKYKIEIN